jgi:hypothetical protein
VTTTTVLLIFLSSGKASLEIWDQTSESQKKMMCLWHGMLHTTNPKYHNSSYKPCWQEHSDAYSKKRCSEYKAHYSVEEYFSQNVKDCPACYMKASKFISAEKQTKTLERLENKLGNMAPSPEPFLPKIQEKLEPVNNYAPIMCSATINNNNASTSTEKNLDVPIENKGSLIATVNAFRKAKSEYENIIKKQNEELEESSKIFKDMMEIIGVNTEGFNDCTGIVFARKCLEHLKKEMESL